jgi:hypothetical protein
VTATERDRTRPTLSAFAEHVVGLARAGRVASVVLALVVAGCGASPASPSTGSTNGTGSVASIAPGSPSAVVSPTVGSPAASSAGPASDPELAYGHAATRDPAFTYQPDVIFVGGGAAIVRSVSADGLTWTIDGSAPGAADLKVGSVMLATSRLAGRVASISDDGGNRTVRMAPVTITDVIRDGHIAVDQPVAVDGLAYQELPALESTALTTPSPSGSPDASASPDPSASTGADVPARAPDAELAVARTTISIPPIQLAAQGSSLPQPAKQCLEVGLKGWYFAPCYQDGKLSLQITRKATSGQAEGAKFGGTVSLRVSGLTVHLDMGIANGATSSMTMTLEGVNGIDVSVGAGISTAADNSTIRVEVPIDTYVPLEAVTGLPLVAYIEWKTAVDMALSGKNSTLSTKGSYDLSGPIGVQNGVAVTPTLTVKTSILDSITGVTIGPSAATLASRVKVMLGVGLPGFASGPFMSVTVAIGFARGSVMGTPIADCKTASLNLWVGGGTGVEIDLSRIAAVAPDIAPWLKSASFSLEKEINTNVVSRTKTTPDSGACH